jgi:hypothetical protein
MSVNESVRKCQFCQKPYIYESYDTGENSFPDCCPRCAVEARANSRPSKRGLAAKANGE